MALLFSLEGSTELTLEFSGLAVGLFGGSFPFLGYGSVCSKALVWMLIMEFGRGRTCALRICASFGSTRLVCASFGSTRLICASFGSTRLMCASFGSTRLICASLGSTRLICAFYGITRLLCRVRVQRGADRREAGRTREGHMDASGFLIASAIFMSTDHSIRKEIVHKARTNLGVNISYQKAWRTKEHMIKILHGDKVESYALIPRFFDKLVESNPGTCIALEMDDSGHFKFYFMTFGASIEG
ncbi:hypothetical protein E6C27_scaffold409G00600 [Cucumis melo var. makuwa]|uniref:DNA-directed RNA polymerase I subunit RPA1-like n=1 Tax=Cucumis melo var. makuwa TaxID=1194695 RepID=A0A5A7UT70_CUCMM|nr:hypothetical protein E6C27_scaffold409G00600 [Cucumis melo var. makuwa]